MLFANNLDECVFLPGKVPCGILYRLRVGPPSACDYSSAGGARLPRYNTAWKTARTKARTRGWPGYHSRCQKFPFPSSLSKAHEESRHTHCGYEHISRDSIRQHWAPNDTHQDVLLALRRFTAGFKEIPGVWHLNTETRTSIMGSICRIFICLLSIDEILNWT